MSTNHAPSLFTYDQAQPLSSLPQLKQSLGFAIWLDEIQDTDIRIRLLLRLKKLALGDFSGIQLIAPNVWEIFEPFAAGWNIYCLHTTDNIVLIRGNSNQSPQKSYTINATILLANLMRQNQNKIDELPLFDAATYLKSEAEISLYLACAQRANSTELTASVQDDIAKASAKLHGTEPLRVNTYPTSTSLYSSFTRRLRHSWH